MSDEDREKPEPPDGFKPFEGEGGIELSEAEKAWLNENEEEYDWVTETDHEILVVLLTSNLTLTPAVLADNINRSRAGVSRRLNALQAGGLVEKEGRGKYSISKLGAGYVTVGPVPDDSEE